MLLEGFRAKTEKCLNIDNKPILPGSSIPLDKTEFVLLGTFWLLVNTQEAINELLL